MAFPDLHPLKRPGSYAKCVSAIRIMCGSMSSLLLIVLSFIWFPIKAHPEIVTTMLICWIPVVAHLFSQLERCDRGQNRFQPLSLIFATVFCAILGGILFSKWEFESISTLWLVGCSLTSGLAAVSVYVTQLNPVVVLPAVIPAFHEAARQPGWYYYSISHIRVALLISLIVWVYNFSTGPDKKAERSLV